MELNAKNFDDKVVFALNRVKQQIEDDANNLETFRNMTRQSQSGSLFKADEVLSNTGLKYRSEILKSRLGNIARLINPVSALIGIKINDLDHYLKKELQDQNIDIEYDYGVFSQADGQFFIENGHYTATFDNEEQYSDVGTIDRLTRSEYKVNLFSTDKSITGSLHIFFPTKRSFLLSFILPSMLASLVFTSLILFCFVYTINIILTQKKVSQMKTDFINNMTHEFKTPIATISLAVDSINNPSIIGDPTKTKRFAGIIKEENSRMLNQVEKVLQIARLDKQDFELKISKVNINKLAEQAVAHTNLKLQEKGGTMESILNATDPVIECDENHISNVIHNLLDNAVKYSPQKPHISIETKNTAKGILISVSDHGIGMAKEDLNKIFEKFYRVSTGNIHNVKGFGLGLSYVKVIVEAHDGKVSVDSELGKGSTFVIFLPQKSDRKQNI